MPEQKKKGGFSRGNAIIAVVLLALLGFLFGTDALSSMGDTTIKIIIGAALLIIIFISVRTIDNKR